MRKIFFFISAIIFLYSCSDDPIDIIPEIDKILTVEEATSSLSAINQNANLVSEISIIDTCVYVQFEDDIIIEIDNEIIDSFVHNSDSWQTIIYYNNGSSQTLAYLGNENGLTIDNVILNPFDVCPLTATADVNAIVPSNYQIKVIGNNGSLSDVIHQESEWSVSKTLNILGLYANQENTIEISLLDNSGNVRVSKLITITTDQISFDAPFINVVTASAEQMAEGMTLINYIDGKPRTPFIIDAFGEIRWYLDVEGYNAQLFEFDYGNGLILLRNGNFAFADIETNAIYEMTLLGEFLNKWPVNEHIFHHALEEKANGNFLLTTTSYDNLHASGLIPIEDNMLEIDRISGAIVNEWDIKESLDEERVALGSFSDGTFEDWFHDNGLVYDATDNTVVVSGRTQGIVKLTQENELVWVIATHRDWDTSRLGVDINQFLLQPLDKFGNAITDTAVLNGSANHPDFEWPWYQHAPLVMPNGNIMCFDNGDNRNYTGNENYSRAVEYKIDVANKTIQQVWQYGKERGLETYSRVVSDVDFIENTNHVLFAPGFNVTNSFGIGGKVIEIDYSTKTVLFEVEISKLFGASLHSAERLKLYN